MKLNFYSTKDYENKPRLRAPGKQTQSKPIFKSEDRRQTTDDRRQKAEYRPLAEFFRRRKVRHRNKFLTMAR